MLMGHGKNSHKVSRLVGDFSPFTVSIEDENESPMSLESAGGSVFGDGASDADSGMASDDLDFSELGEPGTELCQVGNQIFMFSQELYDLPNLGSVLSLKTWNQCLTEEERFALAEYLPDMDQENFSLTLKELFSESNFHFGSPLAIFFNQLKGGLCNPRVVLYREGLNILQRHQHYHRLCEYQNSMVGNLVRIRDVWQNWVGYGIEERLHLLNFLRSQRNLDYDKNGDLRSEMDSGCSDSTEAYWSRRFSKGHGELNSSRKASFNAFPQRSRMSMQSVRPGKKKGILKVAAAKVPAKKEGARNPGFDLSKVQRSGADDNFEDPDYGMAGRTVRGTMAAKSGSLKLKRKDFVKRHAQNTQSDFGVEDFDEYAGKSSYLDNQKESVQAVTIASYDYKTLNRMMKVKQSVKHQKVPAKGHLQHEVINGSQFDWSDANRSYKHGNVCEEPFCPDVPRTFDDSNIRRKLEDDFRASKSSFGSKVRSCKASPAEWSGSHFLSDYRTKNLQGQLRRKSSEHEGVGVEYSGDSPIYNPSEETQSDSSDKVEAGRDKYLSACKSVYSNAVMEVCQSGIKVEDNLKMPSKLGKSSKKVSQPPDGDMSGQTLEVKPYSRKVKKKGKANDANYLDNSKSIRKGEGTHFSEKLQPSSLGSCAAAKKLKGTTNHSLQANGMCDHVVGISDETEENLDLNVRLTKMERQRNRAENKSQISTDFTLEDDNHERLSKPIMSSNSRSKKRKGKGGYESHVELDEPIHSQSSLKIQIEGSSTMKKKGERKVDAVVVTSSVVTPEPILVEKRESELEMDKKTHKKPFTLITPTIHTGFSFSIIHLLSAVRKALTTTQIDDAEDIGYRLPPKDDVTGVAHGGEQNKFLHTANGTFISQPVDNLNGIVLGQDGCHSNLPSLSVHEIVHRVKSNPGDPCILETSEPLHDLVRGVLKIFSSKTAPLGAKGWKALVQYEKSIKSWSWVGPISSNSSDNDNIEEETSAEAWGIPHKMLVKLVDAFANWLKNSQEILQQIGSLPAPPATWPVIDYKDRFRDLRAQKSLSTISPSSEEARSYFQREELLRYSIPDRAFQYTAYDGRKSIVAPLRRGGGKPTSKPRDHYMLMPDRPPHVTVLCLVRDAASRLPGGIGTRADVCTLIRDSQYIVEDVTDGQINQVISGALDRLHYERDPCVQFDGERKLWVYLHGDREEEDFEDDGTSSTKKWKRQRKDPPTDRSEIGTANDSSYVAAAEPTAEVSSPCEFNTDLNIVSTDVLMDLRPDTEKVQSYLKPATCLSPSHENQMLCQENSTNQDFDDEAFGRDRQVGILSASLF